MGSHFTLSEQLGVRICEIKNIAPFKRCPLCVRSIDLLSITGTFVRTSFNWKPVLIFTEISSEIKRKYLHT